MSAMEAIRRDHTITRAFLCQVILDIERNEIEDLVRLPRIDRLSQDFLNLVSHNIPLLARSQISRHSQVQPPLPGCLPLEKPVGKAIPENSRCRDMAWMGGIKDSVHPLRGSNSSDVTGNKRKRTTTAGTDSSFKTLDPLWAMHNIQDLLSATLPSTSSHQDDTHLAASTQPFSSTGAHGIAAPQQLNRMNIPHCIGPPSIDQRATITHELNNTILQQIDKYVDSGFNRSIPGNMGPAPFTTAGQGQSQTKTYKGGMGDWGLASMCVRARVDNNEALHREVETSTRSDISPFSFVADETANIDWDALGANIGVGPVEEASENNALGEALGAGDDGFGGIADKEKKGIRGGWA